MNNQIISGFSKFHKREKIQWLIQEFNLDETTADFLMTFELPRENWQQLIAELSENHLSNFHLPFTVAPNFLVNGKMMAFPLVTEESSVVAALAKAARFWAERGGFHATILGTEKRGQVHFTWNGDPELLKKRFPEVQKQLLHEAKPLTGKMEKRGGGINTLELKYLPETAPDYYQIDVSFETCDAMGANFINSCLEQFGKTLKTALSTPDSGSNEAHRLEIIMAILSNYVPDSRVKVWAECPVSALDKDPQQARLLAERFILATNIARKNISRAVTHNKGIFNGIDALAIATGNDYRAMEAGGHAFAARDGQYKGLTKACIQNDTFRVEMEIPIAAGVVGGVTALHPLAKFSMQILQNPTAKDLMAFLAVAGLASNWSAVKALVSGGIQQGHMKMHLNNILNTFSITGKTREAAREYFKNHEISFAAVEQFIEKHGGN